MLKDEKKKLYQVIIQDIFQVKRSLVDAKAQNEIKKWYQVIIQFKVSSQQNLT